MQILLEHQDQGENLPISEEVVKAAAMNSGDNGLEIKQLLFDQRGENLPVSQEVVKVTTKNYGHYGSEIIQLLLEHRPCLKEVVKADVDGLQIS
jgi:hypothetical protein